MTKKEVKIRIIIDSVKDEFGIAVDYQGFDENTPTQNSLLVASILEVARHQELEKFFKK